MAPDRTLDYFLIGFYALVLFLSVLVIFYVRQTKFASCLVNFLALA